MIFLGFIVVFLSLSYSGNDNENSDDNDNSNDNENSNDIALEVDLSAVTKTITCNEVFFSNTVTSGSTTIRIFEQLRSANPSIKSGHM